MEQKDRNVNITNKRLQGLKVSELARQYKTSLANINRIVADTKAKYPELLINK